MLLATDAPHRCRIGIAPPGRDRRATVAANCPSGPGQLVTDAGDGLHQADLGQVGLMGGMVGVVGHRHAAGVDGVSWSE